MKDSNYTIFLIGFMGCGKSTVSKELSRQFGLKIIEMDQLIAERERMSIPDIFSKKRRTLFPGIGNFSAERFKNADQPCGFLRRRCRHAQRKCCPYERTGTYCTF